MGRRNVRVSRNLRDGGEHVREGATGVVDGSRRKKRVKLVARHGCNRRYAILR